MARGLEREFLQKTSWLIDVACGSNFESLCHYVIQMSMSCEFETIKQYSNPIIFSRPESF